MTSYPEGGRNDSVHQLPLRHSWNRITLKRGVVRDPGLWAWYQAGLADSLGARRDGAVIVLGPDGVPGRRTVNWVKNPPLLRVCSTRLTKYVPENRCPRP